MFNSPVENNDLFIRATVFFDAVGGDLTGKILENMPDGTKCYVYGALSL